MTDTNTVDQILADYDANADKLSGLYPADTISRHGDDEPPDLSTRDAANELIKRRDQSPEIDQIEMKAPDGSRLDPKASLSQHDAREVARHLQQHRENRAAAVAEFLAAEQAAATPE